MFIEKINLKNFKNFDNLNVRFRDGVNLFVGTNGSGKTSLLEGLCVASGAFFGSREQKMQRMIEYDEIKISQGLRESETMVKASYESLTWHRTIKSNTKSNDSRNIRLISDYGKKTYETFENTDDHTLAPLIAYYSTQRLFKDAHQSKNQLYDAAMGRRNGYIQCLEDKAIKPLLMQWMRNATTRRATLLIKEINKIDNILENVEKSIRYTLIDFLNLPSDFPLKIYSEPDDKDELYLQFDLDNPLPLAYYSDGFRNLIFLIIDLVWRASQLNPWLTFEDIPENVGGIVMIDEIDLHLHPVWQAKAIHLIQKIFPKVQFFITTHSPTVVANFTNGTLYIIVGNQVEPCGEKYFGKAVNSILKNILGAPNRHIETQKKLDKLFRMIDDEEDSSKFQSLLDELTDTLGLDDTEIQKALSLIEWNSYKKGMKDAIH